MGFGFLMFEVLLIMSVVAVIVANYGIEKESQVSPLKAKSVYAEREAEKAQTDLIINTTKINGTAIYTTVNQAPNLLNLHLIIKNSGSVVQDPRKYSIILNGSWARINSTSNNVTPPLSSSNISSFNLTVTPPTSPMMPISLVVTAGNGIKIITPTSPLINKYNLSVYPYPLDQNNWWSLDITWLPSYGEMWPIDHYTLYYMNTTNISSVIDKNNVTVAFTTNASRNYHIGQAFPKGGDNPSFYIWLSATDTHGNEGPPSNTCTASGSGGGNVNCNVP